jgi:hypothetical protein
MEPNEEVYRGSYIDAFCQVWFHLAQLFQKSRLKYEKVNGRTTDDIFLEKKALLKVRFGFYYLIFNLVTSTFL